MKIKCPSCLTVLDIEDDYFAELAGKAIACPQCDHKIQIPASATSGRLPKKTEERFSQRRLSRSAIWTIAGVVAGLVLTVAFAIFKAGPNPEQATEEIASTLGAKDSESIKGRIHVDFKGSDLPLKQIPVYLIPFTDTFEHSYNSLAERACPCLTMQSESEPHSTEWLEAKVELVGIEEKRVAEFQEYSTETAYTDNNGKFVFDDLNPGQYLVFVEGTIKDRMTIWSDLVDVEEGDSVTLDFGESNVGGTERVYAFADINEPEGFRSTASSRQSSEFENIDQEEHEPVETSQYYSGDELCDLGIKAGQAGNDQKAVDYFAEGANIGHALCQYNLGASYIDGKGVARDYEKAIYWYRKSANQGLAVAQKKLGICYYRGAGVSKDYSKAAHWFGLAAQQGDQEASQALNELLYEDARTRGAQKSPPDRDAAKRFLTHVADIMVQQMIDNGRIVGARRVGFQFRYVKGNPKCDANAQVDYEFHFYTQAGTLRRNVGYLFFYHDPNRMDWFNSDTNIDGIRR